MHEGSTETERWFKELAKSIAGLNSEIQGIQARLVRIETLVEVKGTDYITLRKELDETKKEVASLALKIAAFGAVVSSALPFLGRVLGG